VSKESRDETSRRAEESVASALRGEGFRVTNFYDVVGNFPLADPCSAAR